MKWAHSYSHVGEPLNELADDVVALMAFRPDFRDTSGSPVAEWCSEYTPAQIKLLYLVCLPDSLRYAYPEINPGGTAIASTASNAIKWGMDSGKLAARIDVLPVSVPNGEWTPEPVKLATYNLCSMQAPGAEASLVLQAERADMDAIHTPNTEEHTQVAPNMMKAWHIKIGGRTWLRV